MKSIITKFRKVKTDTCFPDACKHVHIFLRKNNYGHKLYEL